MEINKYMGVKDTAMVFGKRRYKIGIDIPVGEYFLWGVNIWYDIKRKNDKWSEEYRKEAYDFFEEHDIVWLAEGSMTPIDNIYYINVPKTKLIPRHIYRTELEVPCGYYLYKYDKKYFKEIPAFCKEDEANINLWKLYTNSRRTVERGNYGTVHITNEYLHISIENGIAVYYGDKPFELTKFVEENVNEYECVKEGRELIHNEVLILKIHYANIKERRFIGQYMIYLQSEYLYSVNGIYYWYGYIKVKTFKQINSLKIKFLSTENKTKFCDVNVDVVYQYTGIRKGMYKISAKMPANFMFVPNQLIFIEINGETISEKEAGEEKECIYQQDFFELYNLLHHFEDIDIDEEVKYFNEYPDLPKEINKCLKHLIQMKDVFKERKGNCAETVTFIVDAKFNKAFYCAAKLADDAMDVQTNQEQSQYYVTFAGDQIEEIELMSFAIYNPERDRDIQIRRYLSEWSYNFYTIGYINDFFNSFREKYGYSSVVINSVLLKIIKNIEKRFRNKLNSIYSQMASERRIQTKWGNEYRLFVLISNFVDEAIYQYHTEWLGNQSFDIFLPFQNIAIEYQGQQHYEAIEVFGGEEGLRNTRERDQRKKELCKQNGVTLLEWSYKQKVNKETVINFLQINDIIYSVTKEEKSEFTEMVDMAPIRELSPKRHKKAKKKGESISKKSNYIVQYDLNGNYCNKYATIKQASEAVGVSNTSVAKAVRGERNSAGGFVWKRMVENDILETIDINFDISKINDGKAHKET